MTNDYDFEAILETLEPFYRTEGSEGLRDYLAQTAMLQLMIAHLYSNYFCF